MLAPSSNIAKVERRIHRCCYVCPMNIQLEPGCRANGNGQGKSFQATHLWPFDMHYCRSFHLGSTYKTVFRKRRLQFVDETVEILGRPLQNLSVLDARWDRTAHRYKLPDRNTVLCLLYEQVCQVEH